MAADTSLAAQRFLWASCQRAVRDDGASALSRVLLVAARAKPRALPERATQHCCKWCFSLLVPGKNCAVGQAKHPHRKAARRRTLRVQCQTCGHATHLPMPPPPSAREAVPEEAAAVAAKPSQQPQQQKKSGKRAASAPPPPAAASKNDKSARKKPKPTLTTEPEKPPGDALFGFDFVPLA